MEKGNTEPSSPDAILWQQHVRHWFPRLFERAYFVPPVYMNRVHYLQRQISRQSVSEPQSPVSDLPRGAPKALLESDARDDETQQRVLHCFQQLEEKSNEPMFVISQLLYADFLGDPKYTAAASNLPRPADLSKEKQRGDFDMLLFHKHYGFVAAEIKLVGDRFPDVSATEDEQDRLVTDKVLKALKQLNKAADVLRHLVSDKPTPPVNAVRGYADYTSPPPAQGPPVRYLHHSGEGHNISDWPATGDISIPAPLTYKEVFLLSSKADPLYDTETDDAGKEVRPASAIVKGLRENGVPVVVVRHDDREAVRKVSVREGPDAVVAAGANTVRGLERQVVIALQPEQTGTGTGDGRWERLHVMSRATAKLILVVWPGVEGQQPA
nr:hypothetical protein BaRGS_026194 [Batillaria attramentaria]